MSSFKWMVRGTSAIEVEAPGIWFAINHVSFYLKGSPSFEVVTDHQPLGSTHIKKLLKSGHCPEGGGGGLGLAQIAWSTFLWIKGII